MHSFSHAIHRVDYGMRACYRSSMAQPPKRKRQHLTTTLNPMLLSKLLDVGHADDGEQALGRLIDRAVADYIRTRWKASMADARRIASPSLPPTPSTRAVNGG